MNNDISIFTNIVYAENATYSQLLNAGACTVGDLVLIKSLDNPSGSLWTHGSEFNFYDLSVKQQIIDSINKEVLKADSDGGLKLSGNIILNSDTENNTNNDTYISTYKVIANQFNIIGNDNNDISVFHIAYDNDGNIILEYDKNVIISASNILLTNDNDTQIDVTSELSEIIESLTYTNIDND